MEKEVIMGGKWNILGKRYDGELVFNRTNGGIWLDIHYIDRSEFFLTWNNKEMEILEITGITNQQVNCILTDCKVMKRQSTDVVRHHIIIGAKNLFWGLSKRKKQSIKFNEIKFNLAGIFQWSKLHGFKVIDDNPEYKLQLGYKFKDKVSIRIDENTLIEFVPILGSFKRDTLIENIHLSQYVSVNIIKERPALYEIFFEDLNKVINMIMLATNDKVNIRKIICCDYNKYHLVGDIKNYYKYEMISHNMKDDDVLEESSIDSVYYLFDLPELCNDGKINNWFKTYDQYKSIYELYLLGIKNNIPLEIRFSNLMQSLELIHTLKYNKKRKFITHVKEKFKDNPKLIDEITNNVDQKESTYIILRSRLIDLFANPFELTFKTCIYENIVKFCDILSDSRNYYTHYNKSKRNRCVVKENLLNSIYVLRYIVSCYILENLGFSIDYINKKNEIEVSLFARDKVIDKILENRR